MEELQMSSHQSASWIDTWWPLFLILFGISFVTLLISFAPTL